MLRTLVGIVCCCCTLPLVAQEKFPRPFTPLITKDAAASHEELVLRKIPKADEVDWIRAEQSIGPPYGAEIEPFKVPAEFVEPLLKLFAKARIDTDPILTMPEMGCLLIAKKEGYSKVRICVYCGAQGAPLMFSVNGVRCVSTAEWEPSRGEAAAVVWKLIHDANKKSAPAPQRVPPAPTSGRKF